MHATHPAQLFSISMHLPRSVSKLLCRGAGLVFLNGQILGTHRQPLQFVLIIKRLRRAGHIGEFVSVYAQQECVYIASDGGRVCRPLIICDNGKPRVTNEHTAKVHITLMIAMAAMDGKLFTTAMAVYSNDALRRCLEGYKFSSLCHLRPVSSI